MKIAIVWVLGYTWEILQTIVGLIVWGVNLKRVESVSHMGWAVVVRLNGIMWGVSLGRIIIVSDRSTEKTVMHELGHSKQSLMLGVLYLFIVGIPSGLRSLKFRRKTKDKKGRGYYEAFPENWADKLGGVKR